mgnify:CR=1 FL=1
MAKTADQLTLPEWIKAGMKSCIDYAKERMDEILATHEPTPSDPDQEKEIEKILEEARQHYKERGLL